MSDALRIGLGRHMVPVPGIIWRRMVLRSAKQAAASLAFMSGDHHRVRNFVVAELPRAAAPIPPALIAARLDLPESRVSVILQDLEVHLTFLFRNGAGEVEWAYPVTVAETPHYLTFSTGERLHAA